VKNPSTIRLSPSQGLLPTKICWILSGNRKDIIANEMTVNHKTLEHLDNDLGRCCELETIGITPNQQKPLSAGDSQILQHFRDSYHIKDGRRVLPLPKKYMCDLSPNRDTADRRLRDLQKRRQQDNALRTIYKEQMLDHAVKDQVELAPTTENSTVLFYLPRHAVKKQHREKIKWIIVFDASFSEGHNPSLNDVMEMVSNLLPEVLATLRFPGHHVAIIGVIH